MAQPLWLRIEGARQNNLKNVSVALPHDRVTVITGVSGSGKSSLAFDTIFAEGQWRYIESLSAYARMFLERLDRPDVDRIEHIRPAIALEQKNPVRTARSTVGTATELHDYLRLLFAKVGRVHCPRCGSEARSDSAERVADELIRDHPGGRALVCFPLPSAPRPDPRAFLAALVQRGFARIKVGETLLDLADAQSPAATIPLLDGQLLQVVLDRVVLSSDGRRRITESLETALVEGDGRATVDLVGQRVVSVSREFRCPTCDVSLARPQPVLFSFNHPLGACPECKGFGNILRYDESLVVPDPTRSLGDGAVEPWSHPSGRWYQKQLMKAAKKRGVDVTRPYAELDAKDREWIYQGGDGLTGIQGFFEEVESYRYKLHVRVFLSRYRSQWPCPRCGGARLKPEALTVKVGGATIADWNSKTVEDLHAFLAGIAFSPWKRRWGARRSNSSAPSSPSSSASVSAISPWAARRGPCRAARLSASTSPISWGRSSWALSTCSTSRPSVSTLATRSGWPSSAASWPAQGTPWSSWSTTAPSSSPPTISSRWGRAPASAEAAWFSRAPRKSSLGTPAPSPRPISTGVRTSRCPSPAAKDGAPS